MITLLRTSISVGRCSLPLRDTEVCPEYKLFSAPMGHYETLSFCTYLLQVMGPDPIADKPIKSFKFSVVDGLFLFLPWPHTVHLRGKWHLDDPLNG